MELGLIIIIFICLAAPTTTLKFTSITMSPQTALPTSQSTIIYDGFLTIFPTRFIYFISRAPIIALNGLIIITILPPTEFFAAPPIIPPKIDTIYGINSLLITVLLFTPTPKVVLILASEFIAPPSSSKPTYCPAYFAFFTCTSSTSIAPGLIFIHSTPTAVLFYATGVLYFYGTI